MAEIGQSQEVIILQAISKQLERLIKLRKNNTTSTTTTLVPPTTTTTTTVPPTTTSTTTTIGNLAPTVTSINSSKISSDYSATYVYSDNEGDLEAQILPTATNVLFTGVQEEGFLLTGSHVYEQLNGLAESGTTYKWFRSNDIIGTGEIEIATTVNYTLVTADVGKYIRRSVTPVATGGVTGLAVYSDYSGAIAAAVPFDPFVDIVWTEAFNWQTSLDLINYGTGNDAGAPTPPAFDVDGVRFERANSEYLNCQAAVAHNAPMETWIEFKTPTSFSGTQAVLNYSNTHRIEVNSTGVLLLSGVSTGNTLIANTWYKLRYYLNGASSSYRLIGVTAQTAISLSTGSNGTPLFEIGCSNALGNFFDGKIKTLFITPGTLTAGEITEMETYYGL